MIDKLVSRHGRWQLIDTHHTVSEFNGSRRITKGSQFATLFLFTYLLDTAQFKKALLEWRNILHFAPKDNVNVGRLPSAGVHAYASGGAHAVGCRFWYSKRFCCYHKVLVFRIDKKRTACCWNTPSGIIVIRLCLIVALLIWRWFFPLLNQCGECRGNPVSDCQHACPACCNIQECLARQRLFRVKPKLRCIC